MSSQKAVTQRRTQAILRHSEVQMFNEREKLMLDGSGLCFSPRKNTFHDHVQHRNK
jgi:hypothetical protein